jgi:hypothetical protein
MLTYNLIKKKIGGYFDGLTYAEQMSFDSDEEFNGWYRAVKEINPAFMGWEIIEVKGESEKDRLQVSD